MVYISLALTALLGFSFGYFFQLPVLLATLFICVLIIIFMVLTYQDLEALLTGFFTIYAVVFNIAMWVTYYTVTDQSTVQNFFKTYILR
jgi:hypothetical protein